MQAFTLKANDRVRLLTDAFKVHGYHSGIVYTVEALNGHYVHIKSSGLCSISVHEDYLEMYDKCPTHLQGTEPVPTADPTRDRFDAIGQAIIMVTREKNEAYGNSCLISGKILRILYPHGIAPDDYEDVLNIARVLDKLSRIAHRKDAFGESPWLDICGYGLIGAVNDSEASQ